MAEHMDNEFDKRDDSEGRGGKRSFGRKKICRFCADTEYVMDYKDSRMMQSFLLDIGKIVPRRISGNCAHHQRKLTTEIKRARNLGLVGFVTSGPQEYSREAREPREYREPRESRDSR
jgi:small subunit ribosomal protein S18